MDTTDNLFSGSIPEIYDRFLVPLILEPNALYMAERLSALTGGRILETAAGTGALTRAMAARLPAQATIVVTDLNQPMLDSAAARSAGDGRITWQQADALALPFEDQSFEAVVCQFGVMFFPDKIKGYSEAHRVLEPGGTFLFNVWDKITQNAFADAVTQALSSAFPDDPPVFMARTPHGYHDRDVIVAELTRAGFTAISTSILDGTSRAPSALDAAVAYCQGTPLRNEIVARVQPSLEEATQIVAGALIKRFGGGPIEGPMRALVFAATR